jgi:hypothetical protein
MNSFETATQIMMNNPDFTETATFRGAPLTVVQSSVSEYPTLGEFGTEGGVSFFLRVEARLLSSPPVQYEQITFRGVTYKIERTELDSGGLVYRIYLKSINATR